MLGMNYQKQKKEATTQWPIKKMTTISLEYPIQHILTEKLLT